jgi:hypothetical protein
MLQENYLSRSRTLCLKDPITHHASMLFDFGRRISRWMLLILCGVYGAEAYAQQSLEQRQPLELVFADSIVPQDRHEAMFTTGAWYSRHGRSRSAMLTQKVEWGISDQLQVSTVVQLVDSSNILGPTKTGMGDFEVGARYTWARVGSEFTHLAVALDAGFPTGDPRRGLGEAAYTVSPSILISRELRQGNYQLFSTTGIEFVARHRRLDPLQEVPRSSIFSNGGLSFRAGQGWAVAELSLSSSRSNGLNENKASLTPAYIWRLARRSELMFGVPIGLTSSTNRVGVVIKFTFELGGKPE